LEVLPEMPVLSYIAPNSIMNERIRVPHSEFLGRFEKTLSDNKKIKIKALPPPGAFIMY
jgi:hypothetical protein